MAKPRKSVKLSVVGGEIAKPRIERGVPVPSRNGSGYWDFIGGMEVGDSFIVSAKIYNTRSALAVIRSTANRLGITVITRSQGNGDSRVWRTS